MVRCKYESTLPVYADRKLAVILMTKWVQVTKAYHGFKVLGVPNRAYPYRNVGRRCRTVLLPHTAAVCQEFR